MVEIARQVECGHGHLEQDSEEDDSDEDEDSSNEEDSNEDDYLHKKVESEGSSRIPTASTASTTHAAAAGAGDSPQEIGPVAEHVDEYNEVHDICGNLPGESKC